MMKHQDQATSKKRLLRASRVRKESGGTVMFLVSTTLALMAAIGVYALASSTQEVKASGYTRQATQAVSLSETAMYGTADYFNQGGSDYLIRMMAGRLDGGGNVYEAKNCVSALPYTGGGSDLGRACIRILQPSIKSSWNNNPLTTNSFGGTITGDIWAEATNPFSIAPPPGTNLDARMKYVSTTVTTAGIITTGSGLRTPAYGRGRIVVGPILGGG